MNNRWDYAAGYTRTFGPTMVMSVNLGWNRWVEGFRPQGVPFQLASLGFPSSLDSQGIGAFPSIAVDGTYPLSSLNANFSSINLAPRENRTVAVDFTKVYKSHSMLMGFMGVDQVQRTTYSPKLAISFPLSMTQGPNPTAPTR